MQKIELKQVLLIESAPRDGRIIPCRCRDADDRMLLCWSTEDDAWIDEVGKTWQPTHWLREVETTSHINYYHSAIDITRILSFLKRSPVPFRKRS